MNHFYELDLRIHKFILQYAVTPGTEYITDWIPKLKYLHVCPLWTDIAMPLVLQDVYIQIQPDKINSSNTPQMCTKFTSFNNAQIFVDRGYHSLATSLYISVTSFIDYPDFFDIVFSVLRFTFEWPGVRILFINMAANYEKYLDTSDDSLLIPTEEMCSTYVEMLHRIIPNINRLRIVEPNLFKSAFSNLLVNKYMRQLRYLFTLGPVKFTQNRFSEHLTYLQIALNHKSTIYLPYLCAAPLIRLALTNVPPQFSWDEFYDANRQDISFDNLKELLLSFIPKTKKKVGISPPKLPSRLNYYRLHFPKIKSLVIECCPADSEILNCHPYFDDLDMLMINGPLESTALAMDMGLKKVGNLKTLIEHYPSSNMTDFYKTTNYLFSKLEILGKSFFWVEADFAASNLQLLNWSNLTHILVGSPILVDTFISLIDMLPNLVEAISGLANIENSAFEYFEFQNDFIEFNSHSSIPSASNNMFSTEQSSNAHITSKSALKSITLLFDDYDAISNKIKTSIISHVAAIYHSLNELCVDYKLHLCLPEAIAKIQASFPHISNIKFYYKTADQVIINFKQRSMFDE